MLILVSRRIYGRIPFEDGNSLLVAGYRAGQLRSYRYEEDIYVAGSVSGKNAADAGEGI